MLFNKILKTFSSLCSVLSNVVTWIKISSIKHYVSSMPCRRESMSFCHSDGATFTLSIGLFTLNSSLNVYWVFVICCFLQPFTYVNMDFVIKCTEIFSLIHGKNMSLILGIGWCLSLMTLFNVSLKSAQLRKSQLGFKTGTIGVTHSESSTLPMICCLSRRSSYSSSLLLIAYDTCLALT